MFFYLWVYFNEFWHSNEFKRVQNNKRQNTDRTVIVIINSLIFLNPFKINHVSDNGNNDNQRSIPGKIYSSAILPVISPAPIPTNAPAVTSIG